MRYLTLATRNLVESFLCGRVELSHALAVGLSDLFYISLGITRQTFWPVNRYKLTTDTTRPPLVFISDELPDTLIFNTHKILYHAHTIVSAISLIQVFQSLTRER